MLRKVFKKSKKEPARQPSASSQDSQHGVAPCGVLAPVGQRRPISNIFSSLTASRSAEAKGDTSNTTTNPTTNPASPLEAQALLGQDFHTRGDNHAQRGDYTGAIVMYSYALSSAPTNSTLLLCRSVAYTMTTPPRLDLALIDTDTAVQCDPTNWQAWLQQGETLMKIGDIAGAKVALLNAVNFAQGLNKLNALKSLAEVEGRRGMTPPTAEQPAPDTPSILPVVSSSLEPHIRTQHTASTTQPSQNRSALQDRSTVGIIETSPGQDFPAPRFASQTTSKTLPVSITHLDSVPTSAPRNAQSTEIRNPSSLPGSSDSRNSSTKPPHSFGKLLMRTNRALVPQARLKLTRLTSSELVQAISAAPPKLEAIELLLKKGADPNTCTNEGESALKLATSKDQYSIVQVLLKHGADSMKLDANGSSPIEEAFSRGNAQIVLILLQNAARLDFGYGRFGTCIQAAARGGNVELCTLVVDRGLDTNLSGSGLYGSALQAGVVSRNAKVVEFLLGHGADVNVKGGCYGTSLRAAAEIEDLEICQLLVSKGVDVNLATDASETALLSAVAKGNLEVSKLLLNAGATITGQIMKVAWESKKKWDLLRLLGQHGGSVDDISVPYFGTILQSYASKSEVDKCKRLLENCNVNVNANQGHYATALQAAVSSRSREVVGLLLDHGADPNIEGGEFGTALHAAVACNRVDLCGMLIDAGANLNMKSNRDTALHSAVKNKHSGVARLLLENGADSTEVDADERPALHLAAISGQESLVELLLDKQGGKNDSGADEALRLAAMNGHDGVMIVLLEHGADSAAPDANGRTSLHLAAFHGHESSAKLLLDNSGDVNRKDSNGDGPLSLAAANGHCAVTKLLLRHSAYLDYSSGMAVLRMAIRMKDLPLVESLIQRGVDVNSTDLYGQTILQLALLTGSGDIVRLLREHGAMTTVDAHFERPFRGVMSEEAWTYTTNPTAGWD